MRVRLHGIGVADQSGVVELRLEDSLDEPCEEPRTSWKGYTENGVYQEYTKIVYMYMYDTI